MWQSFWFWFERRLSFPIFQVKTDLFGSQVPRCLFPSVEGVTTLNFNTSIVAFWISSLYVGSAAEQTRRLQVKHVYVITLSDNTIMRIWKQHQGEAEGEAHCFETLQVLEAQDTEDRHFCEDSCSIRNVRVLEV